MRILMFGRTGQVATAVLEAAAEDDELEVIALGRQDADLGQPEDCTAMIATQGKTVDAVINAAALTSVDLAEAEPQRAEIVNANAPGAMATACAACDLPFVHISTDYVFDGTGTAPWQPGDPVGPLGAYGASKLAGERAVVNAGGRFAILRTSWVFSAQGQNFVKTMLNLAQTRDHLEVIGDQIGGPTPASAVAAAVLKIARMLAGGSGAAGTYHFAGQPNVSWAQFARAIMETAGLSTKVHDISTRDYNSHVERPLNSRMDCTTLEAVFGIPRPDWRQDLPRVLKELGH